MKTNKLFSLPTSTLALLALAFLALGPGQTWAATSTNTYNTAGTTSWVCPVGVTAITVECWGGGGAGGSARKPSGSNAQGGGGGAGGNYARKAGVNVTPGTSYTITIGAAATAPASGFTNNQVSASGADTTFVGDSSVTVTATGGAGGGCVSNTAAVSGKGGASSTAGCVGFTIFAGGSGGTNATAGNSSGGGGGAGNTGAGGDAGTGILAGAAGSGGGGVGATGKTGAGNGNANNAAPGGGGGGARTGGSGNNGPYQGSAGALGQIILTYTTPTYYATSGDATSTANWWTVPGGSGSHPTGFGRGGIFVIPSGVSMTLSGTWNVTSPEDTATMTSGIVIQSGGSLACGNNNITGNVLFTLEGGGNLSIGSADGISSTAATGNIQVTGTKTFDTAGNYTYAGTGAQATGNALPASVNNLTVNNTGGVLTLTSPLAINGTLTLPAGSSFDVSGVAGGTCTFGGSASLTASGSSSTNATLTAGSSATVDFSSRTLTVNIADTTHPALNVSQGTLGLGSAAIAVNNNGTQLPAATASYTLVSGTVSGTPATTTVTVGGNGLDTTGGYVATVSAGTGQLVLNVAALTTTTTTIALNSPWTSSSTYGDALVFHATVTGASPGGTVTIKDGGVTGTSIGSGTLSGGAVDITNSPLNSLTAGTHTNIVAVYGGDSLNAGSTSAALATQTVGQYALTFTSGPTAPNKLYDGTLNATITGTLAALVTGDSGVTATGTFAGIGVSQTVTINLAGAAAGNYSITPTTTTADNLQNVAWTNTASGNNWSVGANWQDSLVAAGSLITADFSTLNLTTDPTVIHLDAAETINGLIIADTDPSGSAASWILDDNGSSGANTLTLAGTTPTVTVNALGTGKSAAIGAVVAGSAGLVKAGTGTLVLTNVNTYTGGTTLSGGELDATTSARALGDATSPLTNNTAGTTLRLANDAGLAFNNPLKVSADMTIQSDTITAASAGVTHTLGTLSIAGNTLTVAGGANVASGTAGVTFGTTTLKTANPTFTINNPAAGGTTLLTLGAITGAGFTPTIKGNGNFAQTDVFSGTGSGLTLDSTYTGTVTLNQINSFNGTNTINGGTLKATTAGNALGNGRLRLNGGVLNLYRSLATDFGNNTTVGGNATIITSMASAAPGVTHSLGTLAIGAYTLTVNGGTNANSGTQGLTFGTTTLGGSPTFDIQNSTAGATTRLTLGAITDPTGRTITLKGTGNFAQSAAWAPVGATALTLDSTYTGTATLSKTNTYTGDTTISGGTLVLGSTGSISNSANIYLAAGATLDVSAQTSPYVVNTNLIAFGAATPATLFGPASGTVDLGAQAVALNLTIDGSNPALTVTNATALAVNGNSITVTNASGSPLGIGTYHLIKLNDGTGSGITGTTPVLNGSVVNGVASGSTPAIAVNNGYVDLVVSSSTASTPTNITYSVSGSTLTLTWPGSYLGWYAQSNSVNVATPGDWHDIANSQLATNLVIPIDKAKTNVFYRMRKP